MAQQYEVIVAGGGHNGLIVAAYLAKAGVKVLVLEAQEFVGGGVMSRTGLAAPGFVSDMASGFHGFIQPNPLILHDELQLKSKYGLKYVAPKNQSAVVFPDDRAMIFTRDVDETCQSIAQFSEKDAETYRKFYEVSVKQLNMITAGLYNPSPTFGQFFAGLETSKEGRDLLHAMMVSGDQIAKEYFESDAVRVACNRFVSENMCDPREPGSGMNLFLFIPLSHLYGWQVPQGGSGKLCEALAACIKDNGGEIRTSCFVKSFKTVSGECRGVVLDTGEEIMASRAVVTNMSIRQLGSSTIGPFDGAERYDGLIKKTMDQHYQSFLQGYALNEAPKYKAGSEVDESFFVEFAPHTLEEQYKEFDAYKYGDLWKDAVLCASMSRWDPTRVPEGKHTLYMYHYEPYNLKNGGGQKWDEIRESFADELLAEVRKRTTNMGPENIVGRWISSPLDNERRNPAWQQGSFNHIGSQLAQQYGMRPFPDVYDYRLPVKNLYLTGPSAYPGPGVIGGGRATVQVVMEDLGIDFIDVIS